MNLSNSKYLRATFSSAYLDQWWVLDIKLKSDRACKLLYGQQYLVLVVGEDRVGSMQCRLGILVGWPDWTSQEMTSKEWCCPNPLPALLTSYVPTLQRHSLFPWPAWKLSEWLRFSFLWHVRHWRACCACSPACSLQLASVIHTG